MLKRALGYSLSLHLGTAALLGLVRTGIPLNPQVVMVDWVESAAPDQAGRSVPQLVSRPATPSALAPAPAPQVSRPAEDFSHLQSASRSPVASSTSDPASDSSPEAAGRRLTLEESYLARVRAELEKQKTYPPVAKRLGQAGKVVVRFEVKKDGTVARPEVVERSGYQSLNTAAEALVHSLQKFQPIPDELGRLSWEITVPIVYRLE